MKNLCLLICIATVLASCQWGVPKNKPDDAPLKDTLRYTYKTIKERASDCGNKPDSACTVVKIVYPVFDSVKALNDTVSNKITSMFAMDGKPYGNIDSLTKKFLEAYAYFKKTDPRSEMFFTLDDSVKVLRQDSALTTIQIKGYYYAGGAHGGSFTGFVNWDTKAGKNLTLDDVFAPGYQEKLKSIAEKIFRKDEKLSDTASLKDNYFFKDDKFALNTNFLVTPLGIKFLYNQYEIKPYAAGITELFIPYAQIKSLLQPNTVASQFIK